ncbi:hypothetical protein HMPREF1544_01190 [Mucor circinelloides 1006PhL]|uniref:Uncharacterized protein n=1 Tax=Mucor circinelloides f. circinelloides (strain 1006PhL) TaxID=1220926 RepID=S2JNM6_MUCC1|nr:hypothetical protein HMPREF1544_01190 [Mucor circinelloides 1006PhL]KAG1109540.1 hypothetical protein G6F42_015624 [Rhizopus arrhizus]
MSNSASSSSNASGSVSSSFSNKSCYRLYAGHGNWINLNAKTTQDLLKIFAKGEPCRYQLAAGLFIDIIPNDVDCNSKNIDMVGLMRADLVYEPQMMENHVQQLMSHYIRSLLDEQGIIDAFPPLRQGEDLPIITSLPTHRHLSLVPSVVGTVRRGPKLSTSAAQQRKAVSSSSSSVTMTDDDPVALSSSSSSSATHDSLTNTNNRKRALNTSGSGGIVTTRRSHLKRARQNSGNVDSIELMSHHHTPPSKRHMMSLELPNLNTGALTTTNSVFHTNNNAASLGMSSFMDHNTNHSNGSMVGFHQQQQQQQHSTRFWLSSYQNSPIPTNNRSSGFNFEFGMDFDHALQPPSPQQQQQQQQQHKQSPTDILHDYNISHQMMPNEHDLYSDTNAAAAVAAVTHMHQHHHHVNHSHLINDNQQHLMTTASSSDTTSLESFVPASPIPTNWLESTHQHPRQDGHWHQHYASSSTPTTTTTTEHKATLTTATATSLDTNDLKKLKFEYNSRATNNAQTTTTTTNTSPLPVVDFNHDPSNLDDSKDHVFLTHVDALSSSPSTSSSTSSPTTTTTSQ